MTGGADEGREVAAGQAAERHAAAKREHVDAHHAPAHFVRRDQLDERRHGREDNHQRRTGQEQQQVAQPQRRDSEKPMIHGRRPPARQRRQPHPRKFAEPRHDERADNRADARKRQQVAVGRRALRERRAA